MKLISAVALTLFSGLALAAKQIDVPVEEIPVQIDQGQHPRWEEASDISHDKAAALIAASEKAGGVCHEITTQRTVVCFFQGSRSVGIDWQKLSTSLGVQSAVKSGTPEAAQAMAQSYLSDRFIIVATPKVDSAGALVTAMFMGQECTLNMSPAPVTQNGYGWSIYGQVCGARSGAEHDKWTTDNFGKPRFGQPTEIK